MSSADPWIRFLRFNLVGAIGVCVQLTAVWILTSVLHVSYVVATPAAVALAVVHNFVWHARWTWRDRIGDLSGVVRSFARFALANGVVSLIGNLGVMTVLVSGAHVEPLPASVVAIGACGLLNFWLGNEVVF